MSRRAVVTTGFALAYLFAPPAATAELRPGDVPPAEMRMLPYSGDLPACDDGVVLAQIQRDFWDRERDFWDSALSLDVFDFARETGFRTNGASYIPRRYCEGKARFSDGATRKIVYHIGEGLGFIGLGWGVEWCVDGLDRNLAFAPDCKAAGR